jgi:hypothetical protein
MSLSGSCHCGHTTFTVPDPAADPKVVIGSFLCSCTVCQRVHAAPFVHIVALPFDSLKFMSGEEDLIKHATTEGLERQRCGKCGSSVHNRNKTYNFSGVFPATISNLQVDPALHIFYDTTRVHVTNGLPKFKDLPKAFGGSDLTMDD